MAQFDLFRPPDDGSAYWLDCQSDLIARFDTRLVVPLLTLTSETLPVPRLQPVFEIEGERYVMATQLAAGVSSSMLTRRVGSLQRERDAIIAAFDMLITGF